MQLNTKLTFELDECGETVYIHAATGEETSKICGWVGTGTDMLGRFKLVARLMPDCALTTDQLRQLVEYMEDLARP